MGKFLVFLFLTLAACSPQQTFPTGTLPAPAITDTASATSTIAADTATSVPAAPEETQTLTSEPIASPESSATPFPTFAPTIEIEEEALVFAVIGDYGLAGPDEEAVANLVKSWNPEFIITTGDNNYPDGAAETIDENVGQYYHEFIFPYFGEFGPGADINRFFPTMGNHDWYAPDASVFTGYFSLPGNERYYDFIWGPVHFFALDSDSDEPDGVGRSSFQAAWLQEQLAASTAPWKVVFMHHPPFSSARHGNTAWMNWPFEEWGASIVISGHDHTYERFVRDGFPSIINGLGGYPARYAFLIPKAGSEIRYRAKHGAMRAEATEDRLTFQFITRDNEIVDTFILEHED